MHIIQRVLFELTFLLVQVRGYDSYIACKSFLPEKHQSNKANKQKRRRTTKKGTNEQKENQNSKTKQTKTNKNKQKQANKQKIKTNKTNNITKQQNTQKEKGLLTEKTYKTHGTD